MTILFFRHDLDSISTDIVLFYPNTLFALFPGVPLQVSHLKAACEDTSERTLLVITDELCSKRSLPVGVPSACWPNVVRHYPFNADRWRRTVNTWYHSGDLKDMQWLSHVSMKTLIQRKYCTFPDKSSNPRPHQIDRVPAFRPESELELRRHRRISRRSGYNRVKLFVYHQ